MLNIAVRHVVKRHKREDLTINVHESFDNEKGIIGIFGESGTGKSTFLKLIAGLYNDANSKLTLYKNGELIEQYSASRKTPAHLNPCVYVSSEAILFEHLNVYDNVLLGEQKSTFDKHESLSFNKVVALCGIKPLLKQQIRSLSAGEKQRVQFARALLCGKPVILLDEAFSALDWPNRNAMLRVVNKLKQTTQLRFILVSHSLKELASCCSYLYKFHQGEIEHQAPVASMIEYLATEHNQIINFSSLQAQFVALNQIDNISAWSLIDNTSQNTSSLFKPYKQLSLGIESAEELNNQPDHQVEIYTKQMLFANTFDEQSDYNLAERRTFLIDANKVSLANSIEQKTSMLNALRGRVVNIIMGGKSDAMAIVSLRVNGQILRSNVSKRSLKLMDVHEGNEIYAIFKAL